MPYRKYRGKIRRGSKWATRDQAQMQECEVCDFLWNSHPAIMDFIRGASKDFCRYVDSDGKEIENPFNMLPSELANGRILQSKCPECEAWNEIKINQ